MDVNSSLLLLLKATLLLAIGFAAVRWERTSPAVRRHGVWSATFVALLALPLLALSLPGIRVPVPDWRDEASIVRTGQTESVTEFSLSGFTPPGDEVGNEQVRTVPQPSHPNASVRAPMTVEQSLFVLWLLGVTAALLGLIRSLLRVRNLVASGHALQDSGWTQAAQRITRQLDLDAVPRLIVSHAVTAPMAGNIGQPVVFLPADAAEWDADRRDVVLTHEMTHLARRDPLRILAARVACALYWFHPLMWLAARRSAADCEQACDENVLALGIRPSVYARVLLDFANQSEPVPGVALPIVRRHRLENRLMAILSKSSAAPRRIVSPVQTIMTALGSIALIVSVAAARPAVEVPTAIVPVSTRAVVVPEEEEPTVERVAAKPATRVSAPVAPANPSSSGAIAIQGGSCWNAYSRTRNFSGTISTASGEGRILQRIGRVNDDERIAQLTFDDLRVCMVTFGYDGSEVVELPSGWIGHADRIIIETERDNDVRRLEIDGGRSTWTINGRTATQDEGASSWRRAILDLLDVSWEISTLRGRESSLRGEISSVLGERSSLLGEISSLRGEVSSMQGEISSLRGQESSLRGEISSIRGHESSLRGQISSERGAISGLEAQRWERGADREAIRARIQRHEDNIRDIEREIARYDTDARVREVERQIAALDTDRKVAAVERRIREFDVERRVAEVEREIARLDVDRQVRGIENDIRDLDADRRVREMSAEREAALDRLRRVLGTR